MANLAQMVNAIAPIVANPDGAGVQPIYYPFLLSSEVAFHQAVDVLVRAPVVTAPAPPVPDRYAHRIDDLGPFSVLDAAATCDDEKGRISLTIVNRGLSGLDESEIVLRDATFAGQARIRVLTERAGGAGLVPGLAQVRLDEGWEKARGDRMGMSLPARSFCVIEAPIELGS
jgi:alpha-L-arabinofuranosidase